MSSARLERARRLGLTHATAEAYYHRGLLAYKNRDMENAILDLSEAIYYDRRYPEYYATRGLFYVEDGKFSEAEADLLYALKLNKHLWLAHFALGVLRYKQNEYEAAHQHFLQATRHPDAKPEAWFYLAVTHYLLDNLTEALQAIERALNGLHQADSRHADARRWKAEIEKAIAERAPKPSPSGTARRRRSKRSTDSEPS
ncbi:MAG: tetratricopeptide repeat protein [Anaerolineae bacterium]|nr:tetratricopeptide repeat protein [Anaerolineae bacterium]MDW8300328.1 tetratricopeptide repeat protein [Anaerolineae bacterium]